MIKGTQGSAMICLILLPTFAIQKSNTLVSLVCYISMLHLLHATDIGELERCQKSWARPWVPHRARSLAEKRAFNIEIFTQKYSLRLKIRLRLD